MTLFLIIITIIIEGLAMYYASRNDTPYRMRGFIAINMIMISFFAPKLFTLFGFTSNIGNILYSSVFIGQAWIGRKFGHKAMVDTIPMVLYSLTVSFIIAFCISRFPNVGDMAKSVTDITTNQWRVVFASYWAFVASQYVFAHFIMHKKPYLISFFIGQLVDSIFFFPIAFGLYPAMMSIMVVGLATKFISGVLMYPFLFAAEKD